MGISPPGVVFYWLGTWLLVTPLDPTDKNPNNCMEPEGLLQMSPTPGWIGPLPSPERARQSLASSMMCCQGPLSAYVQQQRRWHLSMWREIAVRVLFNLAWPVIHFMRLRYMFKWHMSHSRRRNR